MMLPVSAQDTVVMGERLRSAVADGKAAILEGQQRRAAQRLEGVLLDTLSYVSPKHGAGAYWLGRAYAQEGEVSRALDIWRSGILSLDASDQFSVRLADEFVQRVYAYGRETDYPLAADVYRDLLRKVGDETYSLSERERLARRLRHLGLVVSDDARRRASLPMSDDEITEATPPSVAPDELLAWWRREDPFPGTRQNEQLQEHLHRVAHARQEYGHSESIYGFDDRGVIYVRLGPPDHDVEVNYSASDLTDILYEQEVGVDVKLSDLPDNEFWSYKDVDHRLYYIFVRKRNGGPFTIGTTEDLLPRTLQAAYGSSRRARQRSVYALSILKAIYRKYSPFHPNMARRHDEVANYLQYVRSGGREQYNRNDLSPENFLNQTIAQDNNRDAVATREREESVPRQLSSARREYGQLEIATRTARFLNENGTTRTEVYWAPEVGELVPGEEKVEELEELGYDSFNNFLLRFTATQKAPNYEDRVVNREHYRTEEVDDDHTIPAQTFSTQYGDSTLYHLGLQWNQHLIDTSRESIGPRIRVATELRDSLRALSSDASRLEMSDLKPVYHPEDEPPGGESTIPYPFEDITADTPVTLYFEVYNLAFGADDRTEYTVEYSIKGKANRGELLELFVGDDKQETIVSSTYEGPQRSTEEYVRLGVGEWDLETETTATVSVTVIDEVAGQRVDRSLQFQLRPAQ